MEREQIKEQNGLKEQKGIWEFDTSDLIVTPDVVDAVLISITPDTVVAKQSGHKFDVLRATFENKQYNLRVDVLFNKPLPDERISDRSKLGRFIKRYGRFGVGVKVELERLPSGYYGVKL